MIKLRDQVPKVYIDASRDFQYLSWIIDVVFNSVKHNVDDLGALPKTTADPHITEILAFTLGFKVRRAYDQKQLAALVSILPRILKYKGTQKAIDLACEALLAASGASGRVKSEIVDNCLIVTLPKVSVDTALFVDLLPYILPAGITCKIIHKNEDEAVRTTELGYSSVQKVKWFHDKSLARLYTTTDFDGNSRQAEFSNFRGDINDKESNIPTVGLLSNNLIPTLLQNTNEDEEEY